MAGRRKGGRTLGGGSFWRILKGVLRVMRVVVNEAECESQEMRYSPVMNSVTMNFDFGQK
jgi:hypothetical protein